MAIVIGNAGASARKNWFVDWVLPPLGFFVVFVLVTPILLSSAARIGPFWVFIQVVAAVAIDALIWRKQFREIIEAMRGASKWKQGADGEALAGLALSKLPDSFVVFHDFHPASDGVAAEWNLDHVVIGPNGVFIVETKNYTQKKVLSAAQSQYTRKNVNQVRRNSMGFKDKLRAWSGGSLGDVYVVPVLVYVQDGAFIDKTREGDVHVIPLKWLASEVESRNSRRELDPDEIYRIANVMFKQLEPYLMDAFRAEFDRFGAASRQFKLDRAGSRSAQATTRVLAPTEATRVEIAVRTPAISPEAAPTACPLCGGKLVQRTARKGLRAGQTFLGCANYRDAHCGFIYNLES